jgi:predicted DNA-binding transcriptional regulator AlpA
MNTQRPYMRENEVAELIGCSVQTLRNHRHQGRGLPYIKFGKSVIYDRLDVETDLESRKVVPDSRG